MLKQIEQDICLAIQSKYPLNYIISWEEDRVIKSLEKIAIHLNKKLRIWSLTDSDQSISLSLGINPYSKFYSFLDNICTKSENSIFLLKDVHSLLKDPVILRKIRDIANTISTTSKSLIFLSPVLEVPEEIKKDLVLFDYPLPNIQDIKEIYDSLVKASENNTKFKIELNDKQEEELLSAAVGLTEVEIENVLSKAVILNNSLSEKDVGLILEEKKQIIKKSGYLEYYDLKDTINDVGGMENLKEWLRKRAKAFSKEARDFGLPEPKGILLLGVQGCGKSLTAKAVASSWRLPLLRFDIGVIFGKYVGESEENIRKVIKISESIAPCILWIDEIEKGFSGLGGDSDSGVTKRVLGTVLTWMQEKEKPVFIVATSNDITKLPPELIMKGRFDEIFFVDLPNDKEREEIFKIHLLKRRKDLIFDLTELIQLSDGFSGAEIEEVIESSLFDAFENNHDLQLADIIKNLKETVPLSKTMKEKIDELRKWAVNRAVFASKQ